MSTLDVMHLSYFYGYRASIQKVIENIIANGEGVSQFVLPLEQGREMGVIDVLNKIQPRIIHLHFSSLWCEAFFKAFTYKPIFVQTVHADVASPYLKHMDAVVCIHELGQALNPGSIVIENTVDVGGATYNPKHEGLVTGLRFHPEKITKQVVDAFAETGVPTTIFGSRPQSVAVGHALEIHEYAQTKPTLTLKNWDMYSERRFGQYEVFGFYVENNNPQLCYGLSLMEAVALGMPVIALRRRQDKQSYISDFDNGILVSDRREFVDMVKLWKRDKKLREDMVKAAFYQRFRINNSAPGEYCELYTSLLNR